LDKFNEFYFSILLFPVGQIYRMKIMNQMKNDQKKAIYSDNNSMFYG